MQSITKDVIVIGAGAAGLMAARDLLLAGKTVAVVEASSECGGRMKTAFSKDGYPVELGAEFIHGKLPLTRDLLKKAGMEERRITGSFWQAKGGQLTGQEDFIQDPDHLMKQFKTVKEDISVSEFLATRFAGADYDDLRFSLKNYVEGYYAADTHKASTQAFCEEFTTGDEEQYRPIGGYAKLVNWLEKDCRNHDCSFHFNQSVTDLQWKSEGVKASTKSGVFTAKKVIITVSIGVLQAEAIRFQPALPKQVAAARALGFGTVKKVCLLFTDAFWRDRNFSHGKDMDDAGFVFTSESFPTWWTQAPADAPLLVGWLGGPRAGAERSASKGEVVQKALQSLSTIFSITPSQLAQKLVDSFYHNWLEDPNVRGAYSYAVVGGEKHQQTLLMPVENTLYFAGEGLHPGPDIGTVEAALTTGRDAAHRLIKDF